MDTYMPLFNEVEALSGPARVTSRDGARAMATRDREEIRRWADRHHAEPATGELTPSGPETVHVRDGGAGIRLNFPGTGRFRPITWDEWFSHFDEYGLTFVYEAEVAERAHALWTARGRAEGGDKEDWFEAERQLRHDPNRPIGRYRFTSG